MCPFISVIIPVYNVAQYLAKCIDSVLKQTYTNIEIILVNDGSTDSSGRICDDYAKVDKRIKVIHKVNGGQSDARNTAIDIANGDYLTFIDSDDYVSPSYIEYLLDLCTKYKGDISACSYQKVFDGEKKQVKSSDVIRVYSSRKAIELTLYQHKLDCSFWGKMFKKDLFNNIRFPKGIIYEDLAICYKVFEVSNRIISSNKILYYYFQRNTSSLGMRYNFQRVSVLDVTDDIVLYMSDNYPTLINAAKSRKLSANFNILGLLPTIDNGYESTAQRCWNNIKALRFACLWDYKVRFKNKIGILISFLGLNVTKRILSFFYHN